MLKLPVKRIRETSRSRERVIPLIYFPLIYFPLFICGSLRRAEFWILPLFVERLTRISTNLPALYALLNSFTTALRLTICIILSTLKVFRHLLLTETLLLTHCEQAIKNDLLTTKPGRIDDNLPKAQRHAKRKLRQAIVIKSGDKGSTTAVMDKTWYLDECYRQLNNSNFYERQDPYLTDTIQKRFTEYRHKTKFNVRQRTY